MLTSVVITSINHVLRSEQWACAQLQSHAGRTIGIRISPMMGFSVEINSEGKLQPVDNTQPADAILTLPLLMLPHLVAREPGAFESVTVSGDQTFASELIAIAKQIDPGVILAHDLSKTVGDIPAHRITQAGEYLVRWQIENVDRLSQALAEYCTEETNFLTKPAAIERFAQEVQNLQFDIEKLEQRLNQLGRLTR
jgi:ubiquinone biosynthesis protein UbiJ